MEVVLLAGPGQVLVLLGHGDEADAHLIGGRLAPGDELGGACSDFEDWLRRIVITWATTFTTDPSGRSSGFSGGSTRSAS